MSLALGDICTFMKHSKYDAIIRLYLGFTGVRISFTTLLTEMMKDGAN
jgi:hypothetical protein